ncbi:MAG TPA: dipeptidase [Chloroflexia bacterium]|nr:dipeptidase [Chloroflexia bacterium]
MSNPPTSPAGADAQILAELSEFLRIPSISTLPEHHADVAQAAQWIATFLTRAGLDHVAVLTTARHPLVYADWLHAAGQPTVLIYGHYDVQPADPLDQWQTPPFEPTLRDGNLYARGAADDKGQIYAQLKAVATLLQAGGQLPINVRFLIEGEEEVDGQGIEDYVKHHARDLACDAVLISDTPMFAEGHPAITIGLRGAVFAELTVTTARQDLHSGLYGGAAPNAVNILCALVARLTDAAGRVTIPGFYDAVRPAPEAERAAWRRLPFDEEQYRQHEVGAPALLADPEFSVLERVWARPTLDLNGISGGFTGVGSKAIIPARASCKVSMRLGPDQDPAAIAAAFADYIATLCPATATAAVQVLGTAAPVLLPTDAPAMQAATAALAEVFGAPPVFTRMGGSIPIVSLFVQQLQAPCIMMGFGLPDDNLHAPNEKMKFAHVVGGIAAAQSFLRRMRS